MSKNNKPLQSKDKYSWLDRNLLLSFSLFSCTYIAFGWLIASQTLLWAELLREQNINLLVAIEDDFLLLLIKLLSLIVLILISFLLSTPVALTTFFFKDSINSDFKGFISILLWSIVLVFAFCSFEYFADLLVILSANLLFRLDLQKLKYRQWQATIIILFFAAIAFSSGMLLFEWLNPLNPSLH